MARLTLDLLRHHVGDHFLAQGLRALQAGRVSLESATPEAVAALVEGSRHHLFTVELRVAADPAGEASLESLCTCPRGTACRHVAAAGLAALGDDPEVALLQAEAAGPGSERRFAAWERELAAALEYRPPPFTPPLAPPRSAEVEGEPCLLCVEPEAGVVRLRVVQGPPGERRVVPFHLLPRLHLGATDPVAHHLLAAVGALRGWGIHGHLELDARAAAWLLVESLAAGRLLLGDPEAPLATPGPVRRHGLALVEADDGYRFRLTPPPAGFEPEPELWPFDSGVAEEPDPALEPLITLPPLYRDPEGHRIGPLLTPVPPFALIRLLASPPLSGEEAARFVQRWGGRTWRHRGRFPAPVADPTPWVEGEVPQPLLRLEEVPPDRPGEYIPHVEATLAFRYGEAEPVAYGGLRAPRLRQGGRWVRVRRQGRFEEACAARLREAGWHPEESPGGVRFVQRDLAAHVAFCQGVVPQLEAEGWAVEAHLTTLRVSREQAAVKGEVRTREDGFDLDLALGVGDDRLSLTPLLAGYLEGERVGRTRSGELFALPEAQMEQVLEVLEELGRDDLEGTLHLPRYHATRIQAIEEAAEVTGDATWRRLAEGLRHFQDLQPVTPPKGLKTRLRPYQLEGLTWLCFLRDHGLHGCLADDMGLGKTVQALALLQLEKEAGRLDRPALVVVPTSLVFNWEAEAHRFTPELKVLPLHGPSRQRRFPEIDAADLVLTTYALLRWDREVLLPREYHYVILDEAQAIKNPRTQVAQLVRRLRARHRLTMTGTPMENHLGELWSQFAFLMPGFLGSHKRFTELFRNPIEKGDPEGERAARARERLARRIRPFVLRRTKGAVALELPPKSEIPLYSELTGEQRALYETVRLAYLEKVRREVEREGVERAQITILDALLRLRQVCCHPQLLPLPQAKRVHTSAKMRQLAELLPEAVEEGRRILIFSQFVRFLALVRHWCEQHGLAYGYLDGATRDRQGVVDRFQAGEFPLFLISLKAGGSGLNLTAADTVIHLDPWWNPAVMDQATDRAHRIGQDKPVQVFNLITRGTVEERILELQARKQRLASEVLTTTREGGHRITREDLEVLFEPLG
ncbi:MAG: hypothetical protein D6739_00470 [Nitrospirae bacterium]|nr:MAG: hypothetical protein D6739_00470 [Nitrospirota bacterium]